MISENKLNNWLGRILQIGIIISLILVMLGGVAFLWQHGSEKMSDNVFLATKFDIDILTIWHRDGLFTAIGLIELGLLILVMAQIVRVAVLTYYYTAIRDYWFMLFSFFILSVILFSLFRQ